MADDEPTTPGLAGHLKNAIVGAHDHLADKVDARKKAHVADVLETFERDIAPMLAPVVAELLDNPATPEHLKALIAQVGAPEHFSSSLLIGVAVGAILGPVLGSAIEPYVQGISNVAWRANPSRPLSPDVLAATVLKGLQDVDGAAPEAALSGLAKGAFATMVEASGQSLGFAEALSLARRGLLVGVTLQQVLEYSNVNPKFYQSALNLITQPATQGEVLAGRIKSHLDDARALTLFTQAGGDPANYAWMRDTAGRPPGTEQMLHLWNRGVASEADVDAAIAQSDIAPHFATFVKELRHYFPPPRSVVPMLRNGAITEAQARRLLTFYGVDTEWSNAFVAEATHSTTGAAKTLTQAQILAVYQARLITRPVAHDRLITLKFSEADTTLLLDLADEKRTTALLEATIRAIGSKYVAHHLTKVDATNALGAARVPNAAQLDLFTLWDIERDANMHLPTPASVVGALRRGALTPHEVHDRLLAMGVRAVDLEIFVVDGWPPTAADEGRAAAAAVVHDLSGIPTSGNGGSTAAKNLTASQITRLYSAGTLTAAQASQELQTLGYTAQHANELLTLATPPA